MKKIIAAGVLLLLLSGCAAAVKPNAEENGSTTTPTALGGWIGALWVDLPGGGQVLCTYYSAALSCDWDNATGGSGFADE